MGREHEEDGAKTRLKHITFDQASLDGSDEDDGAVEVTFDAGSPYRRKSSMVSSEAPAPATKRMQPGRRAECVVHQLIEEQRKSKERSAGNSPSRDQYHAHPIYSQSHRDDDAVDISSEKNMDRIVDSKCPVDKQKCRAVLDTSCLDAENEIGQVDQEAWTKEMTKSDSEAEPQQQNDPVHSRMLTKKQLSDMAWGVRELSRRLSSMRIRFRVRTIFLLTKIHDSDLIVNTRALAQWLLGKERDVKYIVYVERQLKTNKRFDAAKLIDEVAHEYAKDGSVTEDAAREGVQRRLRYWDESMCRTRPHSFDFVITLGGDGTVLFASWLFQRIVPPVLSFSLGSLGFLTKFEFEDYKPILNSAFSKGVTVSLRLRFECTIMRSVRKRLSESESDEDDDELHYRRDLVEELIGEENEDEHTHKPEGTFEILNELVVDRGPNPTMSFTEIFGDDEHFTSVLADGICVSTPTGSTAYNLAAGGSLCHPENPVMLVTSICAHTLSFRPIILPDTIVLRVGVPYNARTASWASFDGRERVELNPGDYVTVSASRYPFASVQAEGRRSEDWINSISAKLGWNTRQKQKGFKEWDK
ncbi:uncharacterized protein TrAtP1_011148 [Trichoderma atroviride]|uniref:ATP-NAD kinase n=1 Tax=Hypocrea atroviridis (strain ATCC 20476 / IMI 206040) TaxID=452589 RepID=G9NFA7_HYPAI|nr:uncharacterized protein TRIATDRAFT_129790 [Trichoderma atroviride IMI 206040]EHK50623.1 hypothetical protein TRIATDRAFT_129790 [Trichoderma atroviride IMI 206040]UKZ70150.1 hypothetical protein TrAtP1_011148 [Trichoderma atroviride]